MSFHFFGYVQVIRGGRRVEVSIYDLVVGDVIPLNIGDQVFVAGSLILLYIRPLMFKIRYLSDSIFQVPADGVLITGHSLSIDESSMTGESKIVSLYACSLFPFLVTFSLL